MSLTLCRTVGLIPQLFPLTFKFGYPLSDETVRKHFSIKVVNFSEDEKAIIAQNPLHAALDPIQSRLQKAEVWYAANPQVSSRSGDIVHAVTWLPWLR